MTTASLSRCTQCGLCLSSCPDYLDARMEHVSPRGRVWTLLQAVRDGGVPSVDSGDFWSCSSCGLCADPCPTGVDLAGAMAEAFVAWRSGPDTSGGSDGRKRAPQQSDSAPWYPGEQRLAELRAAVTQRISADPNRGPELPANGVLLAVSPLLTAQRPDLAESLTALLAARTGTEVSRSRRWESGAAAACGLLFEAGLVDEHRRAVASLVEATASGSVVLLVDQGTGGLVRPLREAGATVVTLPRFLEQRLEGGWGFDPLAGAEVADSSVADADWYGPLLGAVGAGVSRPVLLPPEHGGSGGPELGHPVTAAATRARAVSKHRWLDGRSLVTADPRSLLRFPGARFYLERTVDA